MTPSRHCVRLCTNCPIFSLHPAFTAVMSACSLLVSSPELCLSKNATSFCTSESTSSRRKWSDRISLIAPKKLTCRNVNVKPTNPTNAKPTDHAAVAIISKKKKKKKERKKKRKRKRRFTNHKKCLHSQECKKN